FDVFNAIDHGNPICGFDALKVLFSKHHNEPQRKVEMKDIYELRRCVVTPTRLILTPPQLMQQSRFFRISDPDFALRIVIRDENFADFAYTVCNTGTEHSKAQYLRTYIHDRLINGLQIGQRNY